MAYLVNIKVLWLSEAGAGQGMDCPVKRMNQYEAVLVGPTFKNRFESSGIIMARIHLDLDRQQSKGGGNTF